MNKLTDGTAQLSAVENAGALANINGAPVPEVIVRPIAIENSSDGEGAGGSGLELSALYHAFRRNFWLAAAIGLLIAGPLAYAAWTVLPPKYTATAWVRVHAEQSLVLQDSGRTSGVGTYKSYKDTQRQLLVSPQVLNNALKREGLAELRDVKESPDAILWLQKELQVNFPKDSEIMEVTLSLTDPDAARQLVDAVVSTYYDEIVLAEQNERAQRVANLDKAYLEAENRVRAKRADLRNLVELLGTIDPSTLTLFQQAAVHQTNLLRAELTKVQFDLARAEGELLFPDPSLEKLKKARQQKSESQPLDSQKPADRQMLLAENSNSLSPRADQGHPESIDLALDDELDVSEVAVDMAVEKDRLASQYASDVDRLTAVIAQTEKRLAPEVGEPLITKLRVDLEKAKRSLEERKAELEAYLATQPQSNLKSEVNYRREAAILRKQEQRLQAELTQVEAKAREMGRSSIDADMLVREVEGLDKVVTRVSDDLERAKIELKSSSRVTMLGPVRVSSVGESKKRLPATAGAGLLGLFGPLALLMLLDLRRQLVNSSHSVKDTLQVPILGAIPLVPRRHIKHLHEGKRKVSQAWRNLFVESISGIASMVLRNMETDGHRVFLVTSASVNEGKTTLASELAVSLAEAGHRTLLVDFDFRRPALHRRFKLPLEPGTSEVLREGLESDAVGHQVRPNLTILTAGISPGSLLLDAANGTMKALFAEFRTNYEVVLVDSTPLLPVVDGRLVGQFTDAVILSTVRDVSQVPKLAAVKEILSQYRIPVLGCVVTGDSSETYYGGFNQPSTKRLTKTS